MNRRTGALQGRRVAGGPERSAPLIEAADQIAAIRARTGREAPSVIT